MEIQVTTNGKTKKENVDLSEQDAMMFGQFAGSITALAGNEEKFKGKSWAVKIMLPDGSYLQIGKDLPKK